MRKRAAPAAFYVHNGKVVELYLGGLNVSHSVKEPTYNLGANSGSKSLVVS